MVALSWHVLATWRDDVPGFVADSCWLLHLIYTRLYLRMGSRKTDTRKQKPKRFANLHWPLFFSTKIDIFVLKGAWKSTWIIPVRAEAAYVPSLHPQVREAFGNTDAKICRAADCLAMRFSAISGPTADDQPPFAWEGEWESSAHMGHPLRWNFSWVDFAASDFVESAASAIVV